MIEVVVLSGGKVIVADEGQGIAPEYEDLVFEPFYRVVPKSRGAGLGLNRVKQVAKNDGGKVGFESGPSGIKIFDPASKMRYVEVHVIVSQLFASNVRSS
jgi:signal transduction histidine kinase